MANRISQLRKSMNLSQVDLAKQMGVGQSTISNWESEKTTIDSESLTKLSKLLIASAWIHPRYRRRSVQWTFRETVPKHVRGKARRSRG